MISVASFTKNVPVLLHVSVKVPLLLLFMRKKFRFCCTSNIKVPLL